MNDMQKRYDLLFGSMQQAEDDLYDNIGRGGNPFAAAFICAGVTLAVSLLIMWWCL